MKPILFNTDMVRAILEGSKTVTRRVVKPQPFAVKQDENASCWCGHFVSESGKVLADKPPYRPGDILYVRETFSKERVRGNDIFVYKTGDEKAKIIQGVRGRSIKWAPSIHMPREAARIFLRVTGVRVERLQDITEEQAREEGVEPFMMTADVDKPDREKHWQEMLPALLMFLRIWDSTIKPADRALYGWEANPWVWVIGFERCEKPEAAS